MIINILEHSVSFEARKRRQCEELVKSFVSVCRILGILPKSNVR